MKTSYCLNSVHVPRSSMNCSTSGNLILCGKIEKCKVKDNVCMSIYMTENKEWYPIVQHCFKLGPDRKRCHRNKCVLRELESHPAKYYCCCFGDMCNKNVVPPLPPQTTFKPTDTSHSSATSVSTDVGKPSSDHWEDVTLRASVATSAAVLVVFAVVLVLLFRIRRRQSAAVHAPSDETVQLQIGDVIQDGRFSCVRKGVYRGKHVAVKCYTGVLRKHWQMEKQIFEALLNGNEHILRFVDSMEKGVGNGIGNIRQFCILTEYHPCGSLAHYLKENTLSPEQLLGFIECIADGLAFLHDGSSDRPMIAHRDLKSTNILVTSNRQCCLSDFGVSVPFWDSFSFFAVEVEQVGTIRYLSPEILQGSIEFRFESILHADIYAFALVVWELLTRCDIGEAVDPYQPPFCLEVGRQPSVKDMIKCVCQNKNRPIVKRSWKEHNVLGEICTTVVECWDDEGFSRLTAACVKERMRELRENLSNVSPTNSRHLLSTSQQQTVHALVL